MPYEVKQPPWIAELPRLRDQPVPSWNNMPAPAGAVPGLPDNCNTRSTALTLRRRCGVCGCKLGNRFYTIFFGSPGPQWPGGLVTTNPMGPAHKSCIIYSSLICPLLHNKSARSRTRDFTRGPAEIGAFRNCGIAAFPEAEWYVHPGKSPVAYYQHIGRNVPFGPCKELLPLYDDAIAADAEFIDTSTRLYWSDSSDDERQLAYCAHRDRLRITAARNGSRVYVDGYFGGHLYNIALPYDDDR